MKSMKRITTILMILCTVMAMLPSCEKFNPEEPDNTEIPDNPDTPDNPNIPDNPTDPITKDGVIQKTGSVDLGLSVKWAACDLGGDGFVEDCSVDGYSKYWSTVQISAPPAEIGGTSFDWATSILGEQWQTPSKAQWEELKEKCRISYGVYENTVGWIVTGTTGNAIFFPLGTSSYSKEYWTSSYDGHCNYYKFFPDGLRGYYNGYYSDYNYIRPVEKK